MSQKEYAVLGKVTSPYGIHGWVKVHSYTDPMENILGYKQWLVSKDGRDLNVKVKSGKRHGKGIVVRLDGCDDRNKAVELGGSIIKVDKALLPKLAVGDYYWHQLEGLRVSTIADEYLGKVSHLIETGSNDVLVIKATADSIDERERLIPYLPDQVIKKIDLEAEEIVVEWDSQF